MNTENRKLRPEKQAMCREVQGEVSEGLYLLLADNTGMTAAETAEVKKQLREADARMKIVKNRVLVRVAREAGSEITLSPGPTAMITGSGEVVEAAKIVARFSKETKKLAAKGGVLDGAVLAANDVAELAKLPGRKELQTMLAGTLAAPMTQLVGVMNQKVCSLLYALNAVREKKEQAA